jgi:hypothetical protein
MKRSQRRQDGKSGFDLIEEATHLLRTASAGTLAVYYLGTVPFTLGLLYFWADMSRSAFARQHLAEAALAMAVAFLWMKCCQAVFARRIRSQISGDPLPPWTLRRCARILVSQAMVQTSGLFIVPQLMILFVTPTVPLNFIMIGLFGWVYAFFQNATVLADGESGAISKLIKNSWKQAMLWFWQNVVVLIVLVVFTWYVFLNWAIASFALPQLFKMLFGVETDFTKSPASLLNTSFFMSMIVLTWLCVDPILKVIYTLRCFYGESLDSGQDLKAEFKRYTAVLQPISAALLLFLALASAPSALSAEATPPPVIPARPQVSPSVSPPDLDRAIDETIHQRKYTWRMPREKDAELDSEQGPIGRFLDNAWHMIRQWSKNFFEWLDRWLDQIFHRNRTVTSDSGPGYGWIMGLQILICVLIVVAVVALCYLLYRIWRGRTPTAAVASEPIQPAPDLTDENVGADQLPEDGWTRLARELLERGEFRLAMRAFYLASLAHLAQRNLISLARFKSNRDYSLELRRRGHSFPEMLTMFGDNISVFERIWYGMHDVNRELVDRFAANVERIRAGQ